MVQLVMKDGDVMKILNKEYFEYMKNFRDSNNLQDQLTDDDCKCYANMFSVYSDITNNQFSFDEMLQTYDFVTDVIDGRMPDIMIMTDKYRDIYRLLKRYSITKNLDDDTRKKLAFLIYQAKCIMIMDEETMQPTWNMGLFEKGTKDFIESYNWETNEYPSKYEIKKSLSDPTKEDYGLTVDNPIEVVSIQTEYELLSIIVMNDGTPITFKRIGSTIHSDGETNIDIYEIYKKKLLGKEKIATFYISGYGAENTMKAPKGFRFMTADEAKKSSK